MRGVALTGLAMAFVAGSAAAQAPDPHAGHHPPAPLPAPAGPHAGHRPPAQPADPHAGPQAPPAAVDAPPPIPADRDADAYFPAAEMAAARRRLSREHGAISWTTAMLERLEYRPSSHGDGYAWEGRVSFGGDINRFLLKTEGDGDEEGGLDEAELQVLYSRAIAPYFDLQAGVRQDFQPRPRRTYATVGVEGVAPYWFELGAAAFLSDHGDLSVRLEGAYELRLTQRVILEPRAEANLAAQDVPDLGVGSGLSDLELGLRVRYEIRPELAPYAGVDWRRKLGDAAVMARASGEDPDETRLVLGVRAWF